MAWRHPEKESKKVGVPPELREIKKEEMRNKGRWIETRRKEPE
jgi:hypothetical protein